MTHVPQNPVPEPKSNPYILPLFALVVLAGGIGFGLMERPRHAAAAAELTPPPPTYAEALKQAEAADAAAAAKAAERPPRVVAPARTPDRLARRAGEVAPDRVPKAFAPVVVVSVKPEYPSLARQNRIQGPVEVAMKVDRRGMPEDIQALSGPPALQGAAIQAAERWRFKPTASGGAYRIRFDFKLA